MGVQIVNAILTIGLLVLTLLAYENGAIVRNPGAHDRYFNWSASSAACSFTVKCRISLLWIQADTGRLNAAMKLSACMAIGTDFTQPWFRRGNCFAGSGLLPVHAQATTSCFAARLEV